MGAESKCQLRLRGELHDGKALLETDEILFRGAVKGVRLKIPLASITGVTAERGALRVQYGNEGAEFLLGAAAEKWAERIRSPRTLIDKLDVKAGHRVSVVGVDDATFLAQLRARAGEVVVGKLVKDSDVVFLGAAAKRDLSRISKARAAIVPNGAIWVVHPKGPGALKDTEIFTAAKIEGLTYTKVARFSATQTAEKLVIPRAARPAAR
jgi:hypothetical protein